VSQLWNSRDLMVQALEAAPLMRKGDDKKGQDDLLLGLLLVHSAYMVVMTKNNAA
jgi:hypothetical protein